jgi:hypothetical protein
MSPPRAAILAVGLALCVGSASCQARRTLVVTSEPVGAEVRLDGRSVGLTPVTIEFQHYGTRRVTLYLTGYITHSEVIEMTPPWYGRFPLDLFSEVLVPVGWRDEHVVHADLEAGDSVIAAPALKSVIERSEELRRAGPEGPVPVTQSQSESAEASEAGGGS